MKKLQAHTYYQGESRITQRYEWDDTDNYPTVSFVTYKDGNFCDSKLTGLTPEQATDYITDLSRRNQVFESYMNN